MAEACQKIYRFDANQSTAEALHIYYTNKKKLGEIVRVRMKFNKQKGDYELSLKDEEGNSIVIFSGLTIGYGGMGAIGIHSILQDAGFAVSEGFIQRNNAFHLVRERETYKGGNQR